MGTSAGRSSPPGMQPEPAVVIGAVLMGGRSRRFGSDKALADAGGRALAGRVIDALRDAGADPVVAVGGDAGHALGLPTIADRSPGQGPLAALATVLVWARRPPVLVTPCDLPLLTADHLGALMAAVGEARAAIAVVDGRPQPSLGCWPASFGPAVVDLVERGERSWRAALGAGEWVGVNLPPEAVADADTPDELNRLLAVAGPGDDHGHSPGADSAIPAIDP